MTRHAISLCYPPSFPLENKPKYCYTSISMGATKDKSVWDFRYGVSFKKKKGAKNTTRTSKALAVSNSGGLAVQASSMDDPLLMEAAKSTVDAYINSDMLLGLGTGFASSMAIQYLGRKLQRGSLENIVGVPMSRLSAAESAKAGVPLANIEDVTTIDFAFDDADLIDEGTHTVVVGRKSANGYGSIIKAKAIVKAAKNLAFIIKEDKYTKNLDGAIPIIVKQENWMQTAEEIDDLFLGDAEVWRRPMAGDAGPSGGDFPLVTVEGHYVLDLIFTSPILSLAYVAKILEEIDGVVDHGLILDTSCTAVIAGAGGVKIVTGLSKNTTAPINNKA